LPIGRVQFILGDTEKTPKEGVAAASLSIAWFGFAGIIVEYL
jgi:hypothetical protein